MSRQRKRHPSLVAGRKFRKHFLIMEEHYNWRDKHIWKTGLHLKQKRWKRWS